VEQNHRNHAQRFPAGTASGRFALEVLDKTIGKVVFAARASRRLGAARSALRTGEFDPVIQRIAVDRRAPGKSHSNGFNSPMHVLSPRP
jgi:hypothetical protein